MPRLESVFSVLVTQPYLDESFPLVVDNPHANRIRKQLTFFTNEQNLTLRMQAIDHSQIMSSVVINKNVEINTSVSNLHDEVFRIKAVLSEEDCGVKESYWLSKKNMEKKYASSHNQFRIRGVSKEGWHGDWVYSELRDFDNDLIVYNMLFDILDLALSVHDTEIDYLMDYALTDTFIKVIKEINPEFSTTLDPDEVRQIGIEEWLLILASKASNNPKEDFISSLSENFIHLSNEMKRDFKENVISSPKEFYQLFRVYDLFEQYIHTKNDVARMLVEFFIEEKLEKLIQKTNIEVLLEKEGEKEILLKGHYSLNIKKEMIASIYDAAPTDYFLTCINDAVQLLSEPIIYESLVYGKDEQVEKFLRLAITELYAPIISTDIRLLELEHELEDKQESSPVDVLIEFMLLDEDTQTRFSMIYDVVELLIKNDLDLETEYEIVIVDFILKVMNDSRRQLLIDYGFDELIGVFLDAGESFKQAYNKAFYPQDEKKNVKLNEKSEVIKQKAHHLFKDNQHISWAEMMSTKYMVFKKSINEYVENSIQEKADKHYSVVSELTKENLELNLSESVGHPILTLISKEVLEELLVKQIDLTSLLNIYANITENEKLVILFKENDKSNSSTSSTQWNDLLKLEADDICFNLFKLHLKEPNKYPLLDKFTAQLSHDLRDLFILDGEDIVNYAVGNIDNDGWPIGTFKLGVNTLKGEV